MANDLMEEIVELEAYIKDLEDKNLLLPNSGKEELEKQVADRKLRWQMLVGITEKVK